jgi:hypothetical protein
MRHPLKALEDRATRRRVIVWLFTTLIVLLALYAGSMVVTSTRWFCNDGCHNVHADNKKTYFASSHSEISCMACHYPPNMDPARFALDRVDKLLDIYPTITGTFEMPLNEYSRSALRMDSDRCTQCHTANRLITPKPGMIIDHDVHTKRGIGCTVCHNRVAHPENLPYELPGNKHHEDFMTMRACFRCHTLTDTAPSAYKAPGTCPTCHTASFDLVPASHKTVSAGTGWLTPLDGGLSLHATAADADARATGEAVAEWTPKADEFFTKEPRIIMQLINVDTEKPLHVPPAATVRECYTCHVRASFCVPCHARSRVAVSE